MTIAVTGATGHLGRLAVEALLTRGVAAGDIVAAVRSPEKAADLSARGVQVREADYTKPDTLATAFSGVRRLLLISSSEVGQRLAQHKNAIDAAKAAGVDLIAYTSILRARTSPMKLAAEHKATEEAIEESGLTYTFLRNGWYVENYTENLAPALQFGAILGSAGDGRIAAATRADYAEAAAAVIAGEGHENAVYELGGSVPFTMSDVAAEVSRQSGREVVYRDLPPSEYVKALVDAGLPEGFAEILADSDVNVARGHLDTDSVDLSRLIGRPSTPLADAVAVALKE
ncbi:SDR family oxidoreductase [Phytoactinopolyspora halotolerans]|uniref:SDR family oxidoreductase n=1 Tax=Phytoactinopolyspora halotolerans TaxID=1981512 RepID=A0A6L9S3L6_9ACTN|nr:SDR family oxidoreductase [Phytoactinopolyspora halotolerans]NED99181.1 SDR family oxidoreductase [Phytoactinopolyspora halotolerans]